MKVLFYIDGVSNSVDNDVQRDVMMKLGNALTEDISLEIVDTATIEPSKAHAIIEKQDYDILFTYNRTATEIASPSKSGNLLKNIEKLHVCWLTEHPLTFYSNYLQSENNRHYIFTNESHAFFSESMGLKGSYSTQLFGSDPVKTIKSPKDRKYEMCIAAQWRGPESANAFWKNSNKKTKDFFEAVIELQESEENRDTFVAYMAAAKYYGFDISDTKLHAQAMRGIYWYARKKERIQLVKDAVSSGIKIILIGGEAWKSVLDNTDNVIFLPECSHQKLRSIYAESKSVVNLNAANGACERAFDCLAAGSMLISEESHELKRLFELDRAGVFFKPNHAKDQMEKFKDLIKSGQWAEIASHGHEKFLSDHTWMQRAQYLENIFIELNENTAVI